MTNPFSMHVAWAGNDYEIDPNAVEQIRQILVEAVRKAIPLETSKVFEDNELVGETWIQISIYDPCHDPANDPESQIPDSLSPIHAMMQR